VDKVSDKMNCFQEMRRFPCSWFWLWVGNWCWKTQTCRPIAAGIKGWVLCSYSTVPYKGASTRPYSEYFIMFCILCLTQQGQKCCLMV